MGITKEELNELRRYKQTSDNENIRCKKIIKDKLINNRKLLYVLNNTELDLDEPDTFFGDNANIRDYVFLPEVQDKVKNFVCFKCDWTETPRYNNVQKYQQIVFVILCSANQVTDVETGIARHDLIGALILDEFANSNVFGKQCKVVSDKESVTDSKYVTRTITFEMNVPNSITQNNKVVNQQVRR